MDRGDKSKMVAPGYRPSFQLLMAAVGAVICILFGYERVEQWVRKVAHEERAETAAHDAALHEKHSDSLAGHEARIHALEAQGAETQKVLIEVKGDVKAIREQVERRR